MDFRFRGTGVAMVTPFLSSGEIDYKSLSNLINYLIDGKVEYILVMGTTSESACLSVEEKQMVLDFAKKEINSRVPLMYGVGNNNTLAALETIKNTDFTGVDGILSVTPYYNKPNQTGLYKHFAKIAEASPVPVVLYNVPGRTSVSLSPETTIKLAEDFKNIVGIKEASGDMNGIMKIIKNKPDDFYVISGDDALTLPLIAVGGEGVISVAANAFPQQLSEMVRMGLKGDFEKAKNIHYKFLDSIELMFAEGNPTGVKAFMNQLGLIGNYLRLPLVPASDNLMERIKNEIKIVRLIQ